MARDVSRDLARDWMWSEACDMLARAERMRRQLFLPTGTRARQLAWEPPVDILETDFEVVALVALPGVDGENVEAAIEDGELVIAGTRTYPSVLRTAVIHRLELPQGRFYRRLRLPAGRYSDVRRSVSDGCLVITLKKTGASHG
jgi:HSP20 family protein